MACATTGIQSARSSLIAFLDADDVWKPEHLHHLLVLAERFPAAGLYGNRYVKIFSEAGDRRHVVNTRGTGKVEYKLLEDFFETFARHSLPFHMSSVIVRRDVALQCGGFPAGYGRGEDITFFARMALLAPVACSNYVGCLYRRGHKSVTSRPVLNPDDIFLQTMIELLGRNPPPNSARRLALRECYCKIAIAHALDCLNHDFGQQALRFLSLSAGTRWNRRRWWLANLLATLPHGTRRRVFALRSLVRQRNDERGFRGVLRLREDHGSP